jgi:outer membrane protein OmpA-like peptidoglycan-associated protein
MAGMKNFQPELAKYSYQNMGENRYVSMVKRDSKGDVYVSLLVYDYGFDYYTNRYRHPMAQLDVIRAEPLDDSQIQVLAAKDLSTEITKSGHVALHGIYFDTDSAVLKSESKAALDEIGKLLGQETDLKLFVVGHTDNTGAFAHNMDLSKRRATAVAAALVKNYGVAQERLSAHGVGQLAPVASNDAEEGRAKNRRVELVRQ